MKILNISLNQFKWIILCFLLFHKCSNLETNEEFRSNKKRDNNYKNAFLYLKFNNDLFPSSCTVIRQSNESQSEAGITYADIIERNIIFKDSLTYTFIQLNVLTEQIVEFRSSSTNLDNYFFGYYPNAERCPIKIANFTYTSIPSENFQSQVKATNFVSFLIKQRGTYLIVLSYSPTNFPSFGLVTDITVNVR